MLQGILFFVLCGLFRGAACDESKRPNSTIFQPPDASLKGTVTCAKDLFPYEISAEVESIDVRQDIYTKPGFVSYYESVNAHFIVYLHPAHICEAVFICFVSPNQTLVMTKRGYKSINWTELCETSLRFLPMEQMVYVVENGASEPHVYLLPYVEVSVEVTKEEARFNADIGNGTTGDRKFVKNKVSLKVFEDYDNEDIVNSSTKPISFTAAYTSVILFTSSHYCRSSLFYISTHTPIPSKIIKFEPDTDLTKWFKINTGGKRSAFIPTNTVKGSEKKNKMPHSTLFPRVKDPKKSPDDCCPPLHEFEGFLEDGEWVEAHARPIANLYSIIKTEHGKDGCKKINQSEIIQSFRIEVHESCNWLRICFDKDADTWCESEGNALSLIFAHNLFIPTDSDQAVMLGIDREELIRLRVSFIFNEPGIVLEYAFARGLTAGISHTMQLESYENVGMDPSKLTLHVLKDRYCRARLLPDEDYGLFVKQCITLGKCRCFNYNYT